MNTVCKLVEAYNNNSSASELMLELHNKVGEHYCSMILASLKNYRTSKHNAPSFANLCLKNAFDAYREKVK